MLPITEKDYYTFFIQHEVYKKAIEIGYTNAFFLDKNELDSENMEKIRTSGKAIIILCFDRDQYMIISEIGIYMIDITKCITIIAVGSVIGFLSGYCKEG